MSQALYRKWRPQAWDEVVGQEHVIHTLRNALAAGRMAHAYLFAGPRGTGKTTAARLLAKAANCLEEDLSKRPCGVCRNCTAVSKGSFIDLIEIDAASNTSVEDVRDLRDKINYLPNQGTYRVYIIDEVHMLSTAAFNALLKTLEEPPAHAIFILATTEVHRIPATVLSRCQRHEFRRLKVLEIVGHLKDLAQKEGIRATDEALTLIARQATGAMRDAISLLDQLASSGQEITLEKAQEVLGTAASQAVIDLVSALAQKDSAAGLDLIHNALDAGSDARQFARQVVDYLRSLLLVQTGSGESIDATQEVRRQMGTDAGAFATPELLRILRLFNDAASEAKSGWQPALPLEMAFLSSITPPEAAPEPAAPANVARRPAEKSRLAEEPRPPEPSRGPRAARSPESVSSQQAPPPEPLADAPPDEPAVARVTGAPASENDQLFRQVVENWRQVLQQVRLESPTTQGLLNSCKPYGVKDGALFLGFTSDFVKSKMEKGDNIEITCRVLAQVLGREVPVRCFISAGGKSSLPPDVESDGMVATALRDLGGEVVDIQ